jgi:hypothetical protein
MIYVTFDCCVLYNCWLQQYGLWDQTQGGQQQSSWNNFGERVSEADERFTTSYKQNQDEDWVF